MRDISDPRYESSVDACMNSFLHVIFPAEGSFKVAAHHKVRNEIETTRPSDEVEGALFAHVVQWMKTHHNNGAIDEHEELDLVLSDDVSFNPAHHSTPSAPRRCQCPRTIQVHLIDLTQLQHRRTMPVPHLQVPQRSTLMTFHAWEVVSTPIIATCSACRALPTNNFRPLLWSCFHSHRLAGQHLWMH